MKINTGSHTITLDDNGIPTALDINDIIRSVTRSPEEFSQLVSNSADWPRDFTSAEFLEACEHWIRENERQ